MIFIYIFAAIILCMALKSGGITYIAGKPEVKIHLTPFLIISIIFLVIIRGFAFNTSTDYMFYWDFVRDVHYNRVNAWSEHTEPLFRYTVQLLDVIYLGGYAFFLFVSIILITALIYLAKYFGKATPYIVFFWYIVELVLSLNLYRQYLAMAFLMIAMGLYIKKKYIWAIIFVIFGAGYHTSALVVLLVFIVGYYLAKKKVNKWWIIGLIISGDIFSTIFLNYILSFANVFSMLFALGNGNLYDSSYLLDTRYNMSIYTHIFILMFCIMTFYSDKIKDKYPNYRIIHYMTALYFIIYPFCNQEILMRISKYFGLFLPVMMGVLYYYYNFQKKGRGTLVINMTLLAFVVYSVYYMIALSVDFPYQFMN